MVFELRVDGQAGTIRFDHEIHQSHERSSEAQVGSSRCEDTARAFVCLAGGLGNSAGKTRKSASGDGAARLPYLILAGASRCCGVVKTSVTGDQRLH
jgi:hypothetical protein